MKADILNFGIGFETRPHLWVRKLPETVLAQVIYFRDIPHKLFAFDLSLFLLSTPLT